MNTEPPFIPFGAQFSERAQTFGFLQHINGHSSFWYQILQIHDTYGVPFDLIYLGLSRTNNLKFEIPGEGESILSPEEFVQFMKMARYGAETYGIGK